MSVIFTNINFIITWLTFHVCLPTEPVVFDVFVFSSDSFSLCTWMDGCKQTKLVFILLPVYIKVCQLSLFLSSSRPLYLSSSLPLVLSTFVVLCEASHLKHWAGEGQTGIRVLLLSILVLTPQRWWGLTCTTDDVFYTLYTNIYLHCLSSLFLDCSVSDKYNDYHTIPNNDGGKCDK